MITVESFNNYINSKEQFCNLATQIYQVTSFLSKDYPNYKEWFFHKQLPGIITNKRNILFIRNPLNHDEIIGVANLKKDEQEVKICTIYINENYRHQNYGTILIDVAIEWLQTTKPFITIADYKLDLFTPFIRKYNWQLTETVQGLYNSNSNELCFNGSLEQEQTTAKQQLYTRLIRVLKTTSYKA